MIGAGRTWSEADRFPVIFMHSLWIWGGSDVVRKYGS